MIQIKSLAQLKKLAKNGIEARLILMGGLFSRKKITYLYGKWWIKNYIDDSVQMIRSDKGLERQTNIVKAIKKGALIVK